MTSMFDSGAAAFAADAAGLVFIKSSLLLLLGSILARVVSRSAARTALVWTVVFVGLSALPLLTTVTPAWQLGSVTIPHRMLESGWRSGSLAFSPALGLALIWVVGAALCIVRVVRDWSAATALARSATPVDDPRVDRLLERARQIVCCSRLPSVRETSELGTAAIIGWRRPVLLLPTQFRSWSDEEALGVLCHEMEHIRREDWPRFIAERVVAAIYWPNPLVYLALRISAGSREQAADDAVLRGRVNLEAYASRLIAIARSLKPNDLPVSALAFASSGNVDARVHAMFAARRDRSRASSRFGSYAAIAALPVVLAVSAAQPWTCVPSPSSQVLSVSC